MPLCLADAASGNEVVRPAIQPSLFSPTHLLVCYFSLPPNELLFTFRGSCICANFGENRYGNATVRVPTDTDRRKPVFSERELKFMFAICHRPSVCLSVVCNVRAPYSGDWNFRQCFYAMWYLGHPWPLYKNFTEIVPGEPLHLGLNARGVAKYSDFGPIGHYISETVQDRC